MPHSIISSTGSDHGTITHSDMLSWDPTGDGASVSSRLHVNVEDYSQKLPQLRSASKKYGRWSPRPTPDYVINTSALGRAFPKFAEACGSDTSSSFSLNLGRAPLTNKANTNNAHTRTDNPTNTNTNRPKSPILDALRPASRISPTHTPINRKFSPSPAKENIPPPPFYSQRTRAEMQPRVDDDSIMSFTKNSTKNSRFQFQPQTAASPNVSTKRQAQTHVAPPPAPAPTFNPTQHSFAIPAATSTSETSSATLTNGVPITTQGGRVHARRDSKALVQAASFGPVHSIQIPDEEEAIYLLIEILKNRVARVEAENKELKDFKESQGQLTSQYKQLQENYEQLITQHNELQKTHNNLLTEHKGLQQTHNQLIDQYNELGMSHDDLENQNRRLDYQYNELAKSHNELENQNKRLNSEKSIQNVSHQANIQQQQRAEPAKKPVQNVPHHVNIQQRTEPANKPVQNASHHVDIQQQQHPEAAKKPIHNIPHQSNVQQQQQQHAEPANKPVQKPVTLSASARHVLDCLCPEHNAMNCMLCTRVTSFGDKTTGGAPIRSANPVPVSKRMPVATPYEDEPTIRPSVEPSLALCTVIKGLEDEIAHLKMRQSEVQTQYQNLDASIGKRERRRIGRELESLLQQLEFKGDQLYGLYDVMEGLQ